MANIPFTLQLILHFHCTHGEYPDKSFGYKAAIDRLKQEEIITELLDTRNDPVPECYKLTRKGEVFLEGLCNLPYPVLQYVMPVSF